MVLRQRLLMLFLTSSAGRADNLSSCGSYLREWERLGADYYGRQKKPVLRRRAADEDDRLTYALFPQVTVSSSAIAMIHLFEPMPDASINLDRALRIGTSKRDGSGLQQPLRHVTTFVCGWSPVPR